MCKGNHHRESEGGAIAILYKASTSNSSRSTTGCSAGDLKFRNEIQQELGTRVTLQDSKEDGSLRPQVFVVIHEDGDLTKPFHQAGVLHKFTLQSPSLTTPKCYERGNQYQVDLKERLVLGAVPSGVIGRRISIFEDRLMTDQIAEGIIGWN